MVLVLKVMSPKKLYFYFSFSVKKEKKKEENGRRRTLFCSSQSAEEYRDVATCY